MGNYRSIILFNQRLRSSVYKKERSTQSTQITLSSGPFAYNQALNAPEFNIKMVELNTISYTRRLSSLEHLKEVKQIA